MNTSNLVFDYRLELTDGAAILATWDWCNANLTGDSWRMQRHDRDPDVFCFYIDRCLPETLTQLALSVDISTARIIRIHSCPDYT